MRGIAAPTALLLSLAACFKASTTYCPQTGAECPDGLACAPAPVYCGSAAEVNACAGQPSFTACTTDSVASGACFDDVCTACTPDLEGCPVPGWSPMTSTSTATLNAIWVVARGNALAAGAGGTLLRYDGMAWSADDRFPATTADLVSMWGDSAGHVYVLADTGDVLELDGETWSTLPSPGVPLKALGGFGSTVLAVGLFGAVVGFDGAQWQSLTSGGATLYAVWASGPGDIYAVGNQGEIDHYDGSSWTKGAPLPAPYSSIAVNAVWGRGSQDVYVGGTEASTDLPILAYTAGAWSSIASGIRSNIVQAIWGSGSDVFAGTVGGNLAHFDGSTWSSSNIAGNPTILSIGGSSATDVFAVGAAGTIVRFTGGT